MSQDHNHRAAIYTRIHMHEPWPRRTSTSHEPHTTHSHSPRATSNKITKKASKHPNPLSSHS